MRFASPRLRCATCAAPLSSHGPRCGTCITRVSAAPVQACVAVLDYGYPWDRLIARWKFGGEAGWSGLWADLLLRDEAVRSVLNDCTRLVPIPLGSARLAERGFNQSWELVCALLRRMPGSHPLALAEALVRVRETPDQHSLPRARRLQNLRGAFTAHPQHRTALHQAHVLLVDDVSTTGATLEAAAQALLEGGAASVKALTLARTPPSDTDPRAPQTGCHNPL